MKIFMHSPGVLDKYYLFKRLLIMKLTLFFILVVNLASFANGYSQTKISLNFKDADLSKVLSTIEHRSSYHFAYSNGNMPTDKVTINVTDENVIDVLDKILGTLNLGYKELPNHLLVIAAIDKLADYTTEQ